LGLAWVPVSTLIFTAMLALVFHHSDTGNQVDFFLYVLAGYVLWNFISDSISGSVDIIQKRLEFAVHNNLTLFGLFLKTLADRLFTYAMDVMLLVICVVLLKWSVLGTHVFLIAPFVFIIMVASLSLSYIVNLITIYHPDMSLLIKTAVRFVFFASPIFWVADDAGGIRSLLSTYNPAAYFLSMSRQVFGIEPLAGDKWLVATLLTLILAAIAMIAYRRTQGFVRNLK
jgi:ABC-type polysaccharide/polyol phosphate export permease